MNPETNINDIPQAEATRLSETEMHNYHSRLLNGYPFMRLSANCQPGREIKKFSDEERRELRERYHDATDLKVLKFVPASGAASRMFRDLYAAMESGQYSETVNKFFERLPDYAFGEALMQRAAVTHTSNLSAAEKQMMLKLLLSPEGMDYAAAPKGMILFHKYEDDAPRTAFEEHFHEAALYARKNDEAHLHFTIPADKQVEVIAHLKEVADRLEELHGIDYVATVSLQKSATDTPSIFEDDKQWALLEDGQPLRRPAGHGALLENLAELDADLIFVKNIDNVVPDHLKPSTVEFKQLLAGVALTVRNGVYGFLEKMDQGSFDRGECNAFMLKWFQRDVSALNEVALKTALNRPIRVCGMVENQGEPGGGPFMVDDGDGISSLQIVEKAQIDVNDPSQKALLDAASHFNPVDLVISTKNYQGNAFDLKEFRNENTGMVVAKTHLGRQIRALELPGLWNGGMHFWNTVFVEVPIDTFNPVKTVFDLDRAEHR